jgi:hypothetical protein
MRYNKNYPFRLSWKILGLHIVGACLFTWGLQQLSMLLSPKLVIFARYAVPQINLNMAIGVNVTSDDLYRYEVYLLISQIIGLLVAAYISLVISRRKGINAVHPIIVLLLTFILCNIIGVRRIIWLHLSGNNYADIILKGMILLTLGISLFVISKKTPAWKPKGDN